MSEIAAFPDGGHFGTIELNELEHVTGHKDPGKYRFAVPAHLVESNLGGTSFNVQRSDERHEEKVLIGGRLGPSGEVMGFISTAPPGSDVVRERVNVNHERIYCHVPIVAPNIGDGAPNEMRHPDGINWFVMQSDSNLVVYKNLVPFDYTTGEAQFDTHSLLARLAALEARVG